jgi:tetratricopeptide (TPR) repeat protein
MRVVKPFVAIAVAAALSTGCAGGPEVVRVVDGRLVGGAYVEPEVYASFLRGAIAEASGDLPAALAAYQATADRDPSDPEVWTRIGDLRCRIRPADEAAERALGRALSIDAGYAPAWEARSRCAALRDPVGGARIAAEAAARAAREDPRGIAPQLVLARVAEGAGDAAGARDRLVALTLVHKESLAAWEALAAWGRAHDDPFLVARALAEAVRHAPDERRALGERAVALAGEGETLAARLVASAVLDADGLRVSPAAARLALDAAIADGDVERVRVRAARGHIPLEEAAARALLFGDPRMARALAEPVAAADPRAVGARMVLAAAGADRDPLSLARVFQGAQPAAGDAPFAAIAAFAERLCDVVGADAARAFAAAAGGHAELGDPLVARAAAGLAARGVLDAASLPTDARIELAARQRTTPPEPREGEVDPRHRLLALALLRPRSPETIALARTLAPAARRDGMIASALAKIALAGGTPPDAALAGRLGEIDPRDPIAAAAALDVAKTGGDQRTIIPARARMTALARTPAERASVAEPAVRR